MRKQKPGVPYTPTKEDVKRIKRQNRWMERQAVEAEAAAKDMIEDMRVAKRRLPKGA